MSATEITSTDLSGYTVVDSNGDEIATVEHTVDQTVYVAPESDVNPMAKLALGWEGGEPYRIRPAHVDTISDAEVHLKSNL